MKAEARFGTLWRIRITDVRHTPVAIADPVLMLRVEMLERDGFKFVELPYCDMMDVPCLCLENKAGELDVCTPIFKDATKEDTLRDLISAYDLDNARPHGTMIQ